MKDIQDKVDALFMLTTEVSEDINKLMDENELLSKYCEELKKTNEQLKKEIECKEDAIANMSNNTAHDVVDDFKWFHKGFVAGIRWTIDNLTAE